MFIAVVIAIALIVGLGFAAKLALPRMFPAFTESYRWHISLRELVVGIFVASVVVTPTVMFAGSQMAVAEQLRYEEFYNGVETEAGVRTEQCHPGTRGSSAASGRSNCEHQYRTGETYTYEEPYTVTKTTSCIRDGKTTSCTTTEIKYRDVPAWIYAPYVSKEYRYFIADSIGGEHVFPKAYVNADEPYGDEPIPANIPTGQPDEWIKAKQHLDQGDPRPVTRLFGYDNYILASGDDMLVPYSEDVERYQADELLPAHTADINDQPLGGFNKSYAEKVSFVGYEPTSPQGWQDAAMRFNGALGSQLRGDLHLVVIDSKLVDSPTNYLNALKAYWLDSEHFGRRAIAKNAIIVVIGANGAKAEWSIASTGMPFGNETMLQGIQNFLPGTDLTPEAVIGAPRTVVPASGEDDVQVTLSDKPGVLEQIILRDFPFKRACMDCGDDEGQIGYDNLVAKIQPTVGQFTVMHVIIALLSAGYWVWAGFSSLLDPKHYRRSTTSSTTYPHRRY